MAKLALSPGLRVGLVGHVEFLKLSQRQNEMKAEGIMSPADRWPQMGQGIFVGIFF